MSLLSGARSTDGYDLFYPVLRMFSAKLPGGETTLRRLLSGLSTVTSASDPAVRRGGALGLLAVIEGSQEATVSSTRLLQIQPEVFTVVASGCMDDDIEIRSLYACCLRALSDGLGGDMTDIVHLLDTEHTYLEAAAGAADLSGVLTVHTSAHTMEAVVQRAIVLYGATISQGQLTQLINSSTMLQLTAEARLQRMRRVAVWIPSLVNNAEDDPLDRFCCSSCSRRWRTLTQKCF